MSFPDHYTFSNNDIKQIRTNFANINNDQKIIVTTEKDAVRLVNFKEELKQLPLFVLPVQHRFLFDKGMQFDKIINTFIETFYGNKR